MKLSSDIITRFQIQDHFDFLKLHESDLLSGQLDIVKNLRKLNHERGLQDTEIKELAGIVKSLKKKTSEVLIIRSNY